MYLTGYSKARLLGIAHESYVNQCGDYNTNNVTKYCYPLIQNGEEYALDVTLDNGASLPSEKEWTLTDRETMEQNGWFQTIGE